MFADLTLFQMSGQMAQHAGARQSVIAKNIANADVPGYKAHDIPDFATVWNSNAANKMRLTRPSHYNFPPNQPEYREDPIVADVSDPNGNTVSIETELMKVAKAKLQHDMALQVYSSGLKVLRTTLGR